MKRGRVIGISLIMIMLLLAACTPKSAPAPAVPAPVPASAPAPAAAAPKAPVKATWEMEWEKTVEAAKKEGKVSWAASGANPARVALAEGFKKAYGISVESIGLPGSELARRLIAERQAGLYNYDVYSGGSNTSMTLLKPAGAFDPLEPALILPDVTDPEVIKKVWWQGQLWWIDADHTGLASALRMIFPIAINTNLVKEGEIKSYDDLLSPRWKGKIAMHDPAVSGNGASFMSFVNATLGWDYLVKLANAAEPIVMRDQRLQLDWLTHGKVALAVAPNGDVLEEFIKVGAPVKGLILPEGTWLSGGDANLGLFNKPPHPNAAKVFANWWLGREVQKALVVPLMSQSLRLDVPTDHLPPERLRQEGVKYFIQEQEKSLLGVPALQNKAKELFGPLMVK